MYEYKTMKVTYKPVEGKPSDVEALMVDIVGGREYVVAEIWHDFDTMSESVKEQRLAELTFAINRCKSRQEKPSMV